MSIDKVQLKYHRGSGYPCTCNHSTSMELSSLFTLHPPTLIEHKQYEKSDNICTNGFTAALVTRHFFSVMNSSLLKVDER